MSSRCPIDWDTRNATFPILCDSYSVASVFGSPELRRVIRNFVHFPDAHLTEDYRERPLNPRFGLEWLVPGTQPLSDQQHATFTRLLHEFRQVTVQHSPELNYLSHLLKHHHVHPVALNEFAFTIPSIAEQDQEAFHRIHSEWRRNVDAAFTRAEEITVSSFTTICREFERDLPTYFDHLIELVKCSDHSSMPTGIVSRWSTIPSIKVDFYSLAMLAPEPRYPGHRIWTSGVQSLTLVDLFDSHELLTWNSEKESLFHRLALDTLQGFAQLKHLDVGYLGALTDASLLQIGKLTNLNTLCIGSDAPSLHQLVSLQQLQRLRITFVPYESQEFPTIVPSLTPLGQHLHHLETLEIRCVYGASRPRPFLGDLSQLKRLKQVIYDDRGPGTIPPLSPLQSLFTLPSTDVEIRVMRIHRFQSQGMYHYPTREEDCQLMMNIAAKFTGTSLRKRTKDFGWMTFRRPAVPHRPPSLVPPCPMNLPEELKRLVYPYLLPRKAFDKCLHQLLEGFGLSVYSWDRTPKSNYRDVLRKVYAERDVTCPARVQWTIRKLYGYDLCAQCSDNGSWNPCCLQCRDTFRR